MPIGQKRNREVLDDRFVADEDVADLVAESDIQFFGVRRHYCKTSLAK